MHARRASRQALLALVVACAAQAGGSLSRVVHADEPAPTPPPAPVPTPTPAPGDTPAGPTKAPLTFHNEGVMERANGKVIYFYRTNFVAPGELITSANLMKLAELGVVLTPLPAQNQVLIEGFLEDVEVALDAIAYFDVPAPQVFIEAKVIEITWDSNFEFGLDYLLDRSTTGPSTVFQGVGGILSPPSYIASTLPGGLPFQGTNLLFGFLGNTAIDLGAFDLAFRALQESGKAEVLSKPSIICTQGQTASVTTTENYNVNTFIRADRNNETYESKNASTGVSLSVTAKHIGESYVTIDLTPEVNGLAGFASRIGGTLSPITTKRTAKTLVTMADGETLVIGGLYTNRTVKEEAKTPLLSDIPIIGSAFSRQRESKQKSELVFMLTPRIIRKATDPRVILPPSELERLEQHGDSAEGYECGPCKPNPDMEDVLYPREAACERRREALRKQALRRQSAPKPVPPPPPPPPAPAAR